MDKDECIALAVYGCSAILLLMIVVTIILFAQGRIYEAVCVTMSFAFMIPISALIIKEVRSSK